MESRDSIDIGLNAETVFFERQTGGLIYERPFKVIDLFAGAGGITLGFTQQYGHNFTPVWVT